MTKMKVSPSQKSQTPPTPPDPSTTKQSPAGLNTNAVRPRYSDLGEPSSSTLMDLKRVMHLIEEQRHLIAHSLYTSTIARIRSNPKTPRNKQALSFYNENKRSFQKLQQHAYIFQRAKRNATQDDNWIQCHVHQNIVSSYRREEDGSLSLKIEGDISGVPLFEQVSVMKEVDLYHFWAPFVTKSKKVSEFGTLDQVGWFEVGALGIVRDSCYRAIGCDCMIESDEIIVVAEGVQDGDQNMHHDDGNDESTISSANTNTEHEHAPDPDPLIEKFLEREEVMESLELPPRPKGLAKDRMQLKFFEAVLKVTSPTTANTRLVANMDPKFRVIPQRVIEFIMKHMCGLLMVKMQNAAKKAVTNSMNVHANRIRDNEFYEGWLLPKFECFTKMKGWDLPLINALKGDGSEADDAMRSLQWLGSYDTSLETQTAPPLNNEDRRDSIDSSYQIALTTYTSSGPQLTARQKRRLEELKQLQRTWSGDASRTSDGNLDRLKVPLQKSKMNAMILPSTFLLMFITFYGVSYDIILSQEHTAMQDAISVALLLLIYGYLHWMTVQRTLVSTFDTVDLPVPKFIGNSVSSATRHYIIALIHKRTKEFSCTLTVLAASKAVLTNLFRAVFSVLKWIVGMGTEGILCSQHSGWVQILDDAKAFMAHSAVFIGLCCYMAALSYPTKGRKKVHET